MADYYAFDYFAFGIIDFLNDFVPEFPECPHYMAGYNSAVKEELPGTMLGY